MVQGAVSSTQLVLLPNPSPSCPSPALGLLLSPGAPYLPPAAPGPLLPARRTLGAVVLLRGSASRARASCRSRAGAASRCRHLCCMATEWAALTQGFKRVLSSSSAGRNAELVCVSLPGSRNTTAQR